MPLRKLSKGQLHGCMGRKGRRGGIQERNASGVRSHGKRGTDATALRGDVRRMAVGDVFKKTFVGFHPILPCDLSLKIIFGCIYETT
jgi:hypothetical protein